MPRDYGKVPNVFWSDPRFATAPDDNKLLAVYLKSTGHGSIAGVFRLPDGYVSEDLKWSVERVAKGFGELSRNGFANRCETTKWVWVFDHLQENPLENPNQRKAAVKCALLIPEQCVWKPAFMRICGPILGLEPGGVVEPFDKGSETVSESTTTTTTTTAVAREHLTASPSTPRPRQETSTKKRETTLPDDFTISPAVREWAETKSFGPYLDAHFEQFVGYARAKGAKYVDWDAAFRNAVTGDWGDVRKKLQANARGYGSAGSEYQGPVL